MAAESDGRHAVRGLQSNTAKRPILLKPLDRCESYNYADNPFLQRATALGFKGAYYSWWRRRKEIMATPLP